MRALTRSEALVVWLLMTRSARRIPRGPGVEMPHRRTLQDVRRRAYERGWLRDRYIPAPLAFGRDRVTFALARPPADEILSVAERWSGRADAVVLWVGSDGVFAVFLSTRSSRARFGASPSFDDRLSPVQVLEVESRQSTVPVYFDFEMAWVRATGLPGVSDRCPRALPEPPEGEDGRPAKLPSPSQRGAIQRLVDASAHEIGPIRPRPLDALRGIEQRSERLGWAAHRSLLDPRAVASSVRGFPMWLSFVNGRLLPGRTPADLFRALVAVARVSPFLYVSDGTTVLFAALSRGPGAAGSPGRGPVLPTVQTCLKEISVVQWPLQTTRVLVDHEYGPALGGGIRKSRVRTLTGRS